MDDQGEVFDCSNLVQGAAACALNLDVPAFEDGVTEGCLSYSLSTCQGDKQVFSASSTVADTKAVTHCASCISSMPMASYRQNRVSGVSAGIGGSHIWPNSST